MRFYAWRNKPSELGHILSRSAAHHGIEVKDIGWGSEFENLLCKFAWLEEALAPLDPNELVVCTDSFDVLYAATPKRIARVFSSLACDIAFAAERWYSHQDANLQSTFDELSGSTPYKYLNSGTLAGDAGSLLEMLSAISQDIEQFPDEHNDQWFVGRYFCRHLGKIKLDYDCRLFWCTAGEWDEVSQIARIANGVVENSRTGKHPCIVHVPWSRRYRHVLEELANRLEQSTLPTSATTSGTGPAAEKGYKS